MNLARPTRVGAALSLPAAVDTVPTKPLVILLFIAVIGHQVRRTVECFSNVAWRWKHGTARGGGPKNENEKNPTKRRRKKKAKKNRGRSGRRTRK